MNTKSLFAGISSMLLSISFTGCNEEDSSTFTRENGFVTPLLELKSSLIHTYMIYDELLRHPQFGTSDSIAIYTNIFGVGSGDTVQLFFGKEGTGSLDTDGLLRSGRVRVIRDGDYTQSGSITRFEYVNFRVERKALTGAFELENLGVNSSSQTMFRVSIDSLTGRSDLSVIYSQTGTLTWLQDFNLSTPKGGRKWRWEDDLMTYYNASNNATCDMEFMGTDGILYDETCDFKLEEGLIKIESDREISGSAIFEVDMIAESSCTNIIRISADAKSGFFFISKIGF